MQKAGLAQRSQLKYKTKGNNLNLEPSYVWNSPLDVCKRLKELLRYVHEGYPQFIGEFQKCIKPIFVPRFAFIFEFVHR